MKRLCAILLVCSIVSCNWGDDRADVVAEMGGKQLTWNEISEVVPDNSSPEDSAALADRYLRDWITKQLIISKAETSLPDDLKSFEEMIENYRSELIWDMFMQNQYIQDGLNVLGFVPK